MNQVFRNSGISERYLLKMLTVLTFLALGVSSYQAVAQVAEGQETATVDQGDEVLTPEAESQTAVDAPATQPEEKIIEKPTAEEEYLPDGAKTEGDGKNAAKQFLPSGTVQGDRADGKVVDDKKGTVDMLFKFDKVKLSGYYWAHYNRMAAFDMDEDGGRDGLNQYIDHRFRIRADLLVSKNVKVKANMDILAGQVWGDTTFSANDALLAPRDENRFTGMSTLRELYLEWKSIAGVLRLGQMHSEWGMGLVANSGEDKPDNWNDTRHGDRTERLIFATKPFAYSSKSNFAQNFTVAVGGDIVFQDTYADLLEGDRAYGFVGSMFYDGMPVKDKYKLFAGLYVAYRNQTYDDGDKLEVTAIDGYIKNKLILDEHKTALILQAEGALFVGETDAAVFDRAEDGLDILSGGFAFRAGLDVPCYGLFPSLELGLANGDADRQDDVNRAFTFDPDYMVGMILFPEVLGRTSAWSVYRSALGDVVDQPTKGYDLAVTNGGVTNAVYLYPRLRYSPIKGLDLRVAFLWARSLTALGDPYNSQVLGGGFPISYLGGKAGYNVGYEFDAGFSYKTPKFWKTFAFKLGLMGGWARPGDAFTKADGSQIGDLYKFRAMVDLLF